MTIQDTFTHHRLLRLCHDLLVSPRPNLTDSRREEILAATTSAIADRGLCDTRIVDIAEVIGASPALILYYFPSKAELLAEALVYQDRLFHERVKGRLEQAGTAEDRLVVLIEASCPDVTNHRDEIDGWAIWPAAWELSRHDPSLAAARARLDEAWRAQIASIVDDGIASGEFVAVDPADFSIQLAALLDGLAIEVMLGDPTVDAERMSSLARSFARQFLKPSV